MYWKIEIWANLACIFATPKIILCSFIIFEYGKWYNQASGLFTVEKINNKKQMNEVIIIFTKKFLFIFLYKPCLKLMSVTKTKIIELKIRVKGVKKLKNSDKNPTKINPNNPSSPKFNLWSLLMIVFWNRKPLEIKKKTIKKIWE